MSRPADDRHVSRESILRALHDLQAPARHVRSFLAMFRDSIEDSMLPSDSAELLEAASRAADELRDRFAAIRSVLSVPTTVETVVQIELARVIQSAWKALSKKHAGIDGVVDGEPQLVVEGSAQIVSDEQLVTDLITELLDNSMRFKTPNVPLVIQCQITSEQDGASLVISDNGLGIDPERIEWSMQPFHRGQHHGGFGLGLTRCHCIAAAIGCELRLRSDGLTGTTAALAFHSKLTPSRSSSFPTSHSRDRC